MAPDQGGGERTRTADFYVANVALCQLSYTPGRLRIQLCVHVQLHREIASTEPGQSNQPTSSMSSSSKLTGRCEIEAVDRDRNWRCSASTRWRPTARAM
jgi:hypothetical protein